MLGIAWRKDLDGWLEPFLLAGVGATARVMPPASTRRWRLLSGLPRSVEFGPVRSPPPFCRDARRIECAVAPVDRVGPAEPIEQDAMQPRPDRRTNRMPVSTARSGSRNRPPFGRGGGDGNNGSNSAHNASGSRGLAMPNQPHAPLTGSRLC